MKKFSAQQSNQVVVSETNPSEADFKALQGAWEQVYLEADGVFYPADEYTGTGVLTSIIENTFSVTRPDGMVLLKGLFELNATTRPKAITWIDSIGPDVGKRLPASYILEGNSFVFIAADEGKPRPVAFQTSPGLTMRKFIRHRSPT